MWPHQLLHCGGFFCTVVFNHRLQAQYITILAYLHSLQVIGLPEIANNIGIVQQCALYVQYILKNSNDSTSLAL